MGKYSGILLCSDFDGTLFDGKKIPESNMQAIREFRKEGGLFTVISGRPSNFLPQFFGDYRFGVPMGNVNGAVIYDVDNGKTIRESFMSGLTRELALSYAHAARNYDNVIFFRGENILRIPRDEIESITEEQCLNTYKFIIELSYDCIPEESDAVCSRVKEAVGDRYTVVRSSYHLVEILDKRLTKAGAALFLKEYIGADTLICVGDFENDVDMIKAADIGYAVANAASAVKLVADRITVSVEEGAIAKIIEEIGYK